MLGGRYTRGTPYYLKVVGMWMEVADAEAEAALEALKAALDTHP